MSATNNHTLRRTADYENEIIVAYDRLKNLHHVASQTGFSVEAVRKFLIKKGLHQAHSIRRVSKQVEAQIVEAYSAGVETDEIAISHNMQDAIGTLYDVLRRNGISPNRAKRYAANLRAFARPFRLSSDRMAVC